MMPTNCQIGAKKLICASVYLRCPKNIELTSVSYSGWNYNIYSDVYNELNDLHNLYPDIVKSPFIPMPFMRPCKSMCESLSSLCLGMLSLLGYDQNCNKTIDYSHGQLNSLYSLDPSLPLPFQYDPSNNNTLCNNILSNFSVASTKEKYLQTNNPKGACYGVTTSIYVPPSQLYNPLYAPLLPPYVVQQSIEDSLNTLFSTLPVYLSSDCYVAIKKYYCGSSFLAPYTVAINQILRGNGVNSFVIESLLAKGLLTKELLNYYFAIPSYPYRKVCEEYAYKCSEFINLTRRDELVPNCYAVLNGVPLFPSGNVTVGHFTWSISGWPALMLNLTSPPYVVNHNFSYETDCPEGFVVPNGVDKRTKWVEGTGCALSCRLPTLTASEWHIILQLSGVVAYIGLVLCILLVLSWLRDKEKRKQYLLILYVLYSALLATTFVVFSFRSFFTNFCVTNAVPIDESDGINLCSAQAVIFVFSGLGTITCWMLLAVDLYLKIVFNYRQFSIAYRDSIIIVIIVIPISFAIASTQFPLGFQAIVPICFVSSSPAWYVFFYPLIGLSSVGITAMLAVIYCTVRRLGSNNIVAGLTLTSMRVLRTPIIFVGSYIVLFTSFLYFRYYTGINIPRVTNSLKEFASCVFSTYDGTEKSWQRACGLYPSSRFSFSLICWEFFCAAGQGMFISIIYLPGLLTSCKFKSNLFPVAPIRQNFFRMLTHTIMVNYVPLREDLRLKGSKVGPSIIPPQNDNEQAAEGGIKLDFDTRIFPDTRIGRI